MELPQKLESNPLDARLNKEAETAVKQLIEVKDVQVAICGAVFSDLGSSKSKYLARSRVNISSQAQRS